MSIQIRQKDQTEAERRKRTREVYQALNLAVNNNSGHKQLSPAKQSSVIQTVLGTCYGHYGLNWLHKAITAVRRNSDLFQDEDSEGRTRLRTDNTERLIKKVETNPSRCDDPRWDVIGIANQRIQYLRGDHDD